jgi:hypothetical protein
MAQPRKKSGSRSAAVSRTPSAKKADPASAPTPSKRSKTKPAQIEPVAERSAGPVNPDSMSAEVIEFITAVDEYKRKRGRPFPSWSEILEVVKQLGYRKAS